MEGGWEERRKRGGTYLLRQPRPLRWSSWPTRPHLPPKRAYAARRAWSSSEVQSSFLRDGSRASR